MDAAERKDSDEDESMYRTAVVEQEDDDNQTIDNADNELIGDGAC